MAFRLTSSPTPVEATGDRLPAARRHTQSGILRALSQGRGSLLLVARLAACAPGEDFRDLNLLLNLLFLINHQLSVFHVQVRNEIGELEFFAIGGIGELLLQGRVDH